MGYTKNIAVIKELKSGFSADGGQVSGLVKAEKYGLTLKIEITLINFAPLAEGRYTAALSDGKNTVILDGLSFDGISPVDTSGGFAALICFVNGAVSPVASAVCGNYQSVCLGLKDEIERLEKVKPKAEPEPEKYEDEALAQENYYEYGETDKDGGAVRQDEEKKAGGQKSFEDEKASGAFEEECAGGLARGECFFVKMKDEIEKVLSSYPAEQGLESTVENSRWVKITYGDGKFYAFGLIYSGGKPEYICYGVPAEDINRPPESLSLTSSFIPSSPDGKTGYWVMYQDANTGASVKLNRA